MQPWVNIFRVVVLVIGVSALSFDVLLYNAFERQKNETGILNDQQKLQTQLDNNKFKYQQDEIDRLSKDLGDAQQQIKDQGDALADQQDENKNIETSLVDIKAEADAIKQGMKAWQQDYVSILAQIEKKMDNTRTDVAGLKDSVSGLKDEIDRMANAAAQTTQNSQTDQQAPQLANQP